MKELNELRRSVNEWFFCHPEPGLGNQIWLYGFLGLALVGSIAYLVTW